MKLRNPFLVRLAGFLAGLLIRGWIGSLRYRMDFRASGIHPADPKKQRILYAFWHESLLIATHFRTRGYVLASQHADGELIAQAARTLGFGVVRGSTTRGGTEALLEMIRVSQKAHLGLTPDGPQGPRRQVQIGLILLASRTGLPIVAFGVGFAKAWRARSWDRLAIPWPWSTVFCVGTPPMVIPPRINRVQMEHYRKLVQEQLDAAVEAAESWARTGVRPPPQTLKTLAELRQTA